MAGGIAALVIMAAMLGAVIYFGIKGRRGSRFARSPHDDVHVGSSDHRPEEGLASDHGWDDGGGHHDGGSGHH